MKLNFLKKFYLNQIILISIIVIFSSCQKDEITPDEKPTEIEKPEPFSFIKKGNEFHYQYSYTMRSHSYDYTSNGIQVVKINSDLGNNHFGITDSVIINTEYIDTTIVSNDNIWFIDSVGWNSIVDEEKSLLIKSEPKLGDITFYVSEGDTIFSKTESLNETVIVPAGTFNCIKIHDYSGSSSEFTFSEYRYIAHNTGIIKTTSTFDIYGSEYRSVYELTQKNF